MSGMKKRSAQIKHTGTGTRQPAAPFSLLVKPAGADCNIACDYCFYLEKAKLYPEENRHRMSDETLEQLISGYMATPQPVYSFGWQGGEPTLMGVDFFRRVTELQRRYGRPGSTVSNGLQTNGIAVTDELAAHLARHNFLVGVSLDGPEEIHNVYRHTREGNRTYTQVRRGIETLARHGVEFNILVLVSQANVGRAREVYRFLRDEGFYYQQYIPCVEFLSDGSPAPWSITGEEWGRFHIDLYDEWQQNDTRRVSIRYFDSILQLLVNGRYAQCTMGGNCAGYLVVEHNGDVYPCDFFVTDELRLGNIHTHNWRELATSPLRRKFAAGKTRWPEDCARCEYLPYCSGDCMKHRPPGQTSVLCSGTKAFLDHALPGFRRLGTEYLAANQAERAGGLFLDSSGRPAAYGGEGENSACYCGSGKRYKNCHGKVLHERA